MNLGMRVDAVILPKYANETDDEYDRRKADMLAALARTIATPTAKPAEEPTLVRLTVLPTPGHFLAPAVKVSL